MLLRLKALDVVVLALCSMGTSVKAIKNHIAAVVPTAAGEIGVNLVDPIPSADALIGKIGKNTKYLTDLGGATTSTTVTVTTAGTAATVTKDASVAVTQDTDGNFSILLGPALRSKIIEIAKTIPACGAKKRAAACGYMAFTEAVAQFGPIREVAEIENAMPAGRFIIPANDIAQLVALFQAGAAATVSPAAAVGGGTLGLLYILYDQWNSNQDIAPVMDVPNSVAGKATTASATSTTATACPDPTALPSCSDEDCKGDKDRKCTVGKHKGCKCAALEVEISTDVPTEWVNLRSLVEQITLTAETQPVPLCTENNKVSMETKMWKTIVTNVCASQPLSADISAIQTAKDVGFPGYDGWSFALSWRHSKGDCVFGCEEMFHGFLRSTQCSYNSHTFSGSGKNTQSCGTASFYVNQPIVAPIVASKPSPTPELPTATPVGPPQGVPICGSGFFFQRSDAAASAKTFCKQLVKDGSWVKGPQGMRFSNVKIYNGDQTVHPNQNLVLSVNSNAGWCPKDLTPDALAKTNDGRSLCG